MRGKRGSETAASLSGDGPLTFFDYDDLCDVGMDSTRAAGRLSDTTCNLKARYSEADPIERPARLQVQ
jgi:hypothetical protein